MSDLAPAPAAVPDGAPAESGEAQGAPAPAPTPAESRPEPEGHPRSKRRGGLPDDLSLAGKPKEPKEPKLAAGLKTIETHTPEGEPRPKLPDEEPKAPDEPAAPPDEPAAGPDGEPQAPDTPPEIPDSYEFEITTDEERGPEKWTLEELKSAAKLTEEAIKWKDLGEAAVTQRNKLVDDIRTNPMETLLNVATALVGDRNQARAWLTRHATALVNENIAYEEMPQHQRDAMEKDRIIEDLRAQLGEKQQADAEAARTREEQEAFQRTYNEIVTATEALGREPEEEFIQEVANVLDQAHLAGHTHITASTAAKMVLKELEEREQAQWEKFDPEKAPPEVLERFRQFEVARAKANVRPTAAPRTEEPTRRRSRRIAGL